MTLSQFAEIFALLAVQLRATDADEITIRGYYEALKDIEPEFLAMAATEFAKGAEWFPKTSEWRQAAAHVAYRRREEQAAMLRNLAVPLCLACSDTGWAMQGDRAYRCECQDLRKLELLGRRPWPKMIQAPQAAAERTVDELMARVKASVKGFRLVKGEQA